MNIDAYVDDDYQQRYGDQETPELNNQTNIRASLDQKQKSNIKNEKDQDNREFSHDEKLDEKNI